MLLSGALMKTNRTLAACAVALSLSGCVTVEQMDEVYGSQQRPSAEVKAQVINYVRGEFFDPYSIRDAEISGVVRLLDTGYHAVCVRMNAKNRMGGYIGMTVTSFRLSGTAVIGTLQDAPACKSAQLVYEPFPELEAL